MKTPIYDFVNGYRYASPVRFHMPAHKGVCFLGPEPFDITEISGADELFLPDGIIAQSEKNASDIFACQTLYSTGGSTLCIQAMLFLIKSFCEQSGKTPTVLASRNSHKAFINSAALLKMDVSWIYPKDICSYLECKITPDDIENAILSSSTPPAAVYITTPDYLGNMANIKRISEICKKHGVLLAVDAAHGAYLKFLPESLHPIDLGADICCTSAHKTLPVLTGGAYLHISEYAPSVFKNKAKTAMSFFGSSSPSYLILQSLDLFCNEAENFKSKLPDFFKKVDELKRYIKNIGFDLKNTEPMKITISPKNYGYTGRKLGKILEENGIFPEFYDPDFLGLMLSPYNSDEDLTALKKVLSNIEKKEQILSSPPVFSNTKTALSLSKAIFAATETVAVKEAEGRICGGYPISCPPAIPIAISGEIIDKNTVLALEYYGIKNCTVIKQK